MANEFGYINGFVERKTGGGYEGHISIERIDLSPLECVFFKDENGDNYLWLKRKPIMDYDFATQSYTTRKRKPHFEAYLKKQMDDDGVVAYKGEFVFMRFKFSIIGIWDVVLGSDLKHQRLNLFVERLPLSQQTILNSINERNIENEGRRRH